MPRTASRRTSAKTPTSEELKAQDEGYKLAKSNAVKFLYGRRQAIFALARHYHLDADDLQQEAYEILLTCLRDFNPLYQKADGEEVSVQFNTFFGNRLESKGQEMRNRDPEYQARQAHLQDMSDADREEFRKNPPLLVQHLDQETTMQEHLASEVSSAQRARQTNVMMKIAQDSFIERKLNDLIAAERDDKRRAALMHVKMGGIASFEEIAYHFGVTDSRASQILNELMDAFYVQRLLDGDLKSVVYDFRKLSLQPKRAQRLLADAIEHSTSARAAEIASAFGTEFPELHELLTEVLKQQRLAAPQLEEGAEPGDMPIAALSAQMNEQEERVYPLCEVAWKDLSELKVLDVIFRPATVGEAHMLPHIRKLTEHEPETWPPLLVSEDGYVIDGERRMAAAEARGSTRLLCQVRQFPSERDSKILRVILNSRVIPLDKIELYYAIGALAGMGVTQGKIAEYLGTSRPNVIVYSKVRERASARLRQLFEDGLIQITNASSAVELPEPAQDQMADFIRQHGASWGRGPQFNELYEAAAAGQIAELAPPSSLTAQHISMPVSAPMPSAPAVPISSPVLGPQVTNAIRKRQEVLEFALKDAEIWAKQREATIASQTGTIQELRQQIEGLKRELEAQSLLAHGDQASMASYVKELKQFYAIQERMVTATHHLEKASGQLRSISLTHRQTLELEQQLEKVDEARTALRVILVKTPTQR
jgi:ParB-like chromosome segregation protein Spo0J